MKNIVLLGLMALVFSSCEKPKYGCTDSTASNYDASANRGQNSTCTYDGSAVFYQAIDNGKVSVTMGSQTIVVTKYYPSNNAYCGADGCATFKLPIGEYNYSATGPTKYWAGKLTITTNGCFKIVLP